MKPWTRFVKSGTPGSRERTESSSKARKYTLLSRRAKPLAGGASIAESVVAANKRLKQGLSAQGDVQPTVGLQAGGVGAADSSSVGSRPCDGSASNRTRSSPDGRGPLGWGSRRIAMRRNKVPLGFVEGINNKNPRHPKAGLRSSRRGVPSPQNPDVHVARKSENRPKVTHTLCKEPENKEFADALLRDERAKQKERDDKDEARGRPRREGNQRTLQEPERQYGPRRTGPLWPRMSTGSKAGSLTTRVGTIASMPRGRKTPLRKTSRS